MLIVSTSARILGFIQRKLFGYFFLDFLYIYRFVFITHLLLVFAN